MTISYVPKPGYVAFAARATPDGKGGYVVRYTPKAFRPFYLDDRGRWRAGDQRQIVGVGNCLAWLSKWLAGLRSAQRRLFCRQR